MHQPSVGQFGILGLRRTNFAPRRELHAFFAVLASSSPIALHSAAAAGTDADSIAALHRKLASPGSRILAQRQASDNSRVHRAPVHERDATDGHAALISRSTGSVARRGRRHQFQAIAGDRLRSGGFFARDGVRLLVWSRHAAQMWDLNNVVPLAELIFPGKNFDRIVHSDDDTRIATWAHVDGEMRIRDSASGCLVASIRPPANTGRWAPLVFLFSGRFIRIGNSIYPVPPSSGNQAVPEWLLRLATAVAGGEIDQRGGVLSVRRFGRHGRDAHVTSSPRAGRPCHLEPSVGKPEPDSIRCADRARRGMGVPPMFCVPRASRPWLTKCIKI